MSSPSRSGGRWAQKQRLFIDEVPTPPKQLRVKSPKRSKQLQRSKQPKQQKSSSVEQAWKLELRNAKLEKRAAGGGSKSKWVLEYLRASGSFNPLE